MMRRRYRLGLIAVATVTVAGAWYVVFNRRIPKLYGGPRNVAIVARPDKVEAFRVEQASERARTDDAQFSDWATIAGPATLSPETAAEVSAALVSPSSYEWHYAKGCWPNFGARLSFHQGSEQVDVLLCFECDILWIVRNGRRIGGEDFDDVRAVLARAVKEAFPDDEVIQSLDEAR